DGLAERRESGGATGSDRHRRTGETVGDGELTGGGVRHGRGEQTGARAGGPLGREPALVGRVGQEAPERRAEHDAGPRLGGGGCTHPTRPGTRAAFTPAKPDEVDTAVSAGWRRGSPYTRSRPAQAGSTVARPAVGGTNPSARTWRQRMASKAPAAPSVWPIAPLMELTGTLRGPKARVIAIASIAAWEGVPVPCAEADAPPPGAHAG